MRRLTVALSLIASVEACGANGGSSVPVDMLCRAPEDASWAWSVLLHVRDASTHQPVDQTPAFYADGAAVNAQCFGDGGAFFDLAASACGGWSLDLLGNFTVEVDVAGYAPATVTVMNDYVLDGCPAQTPVEATVLVTPIASADGAPDAAPSDGGLFD